VPIALRWTGFWTRGVGFPLLSPKPFKPDGGGVGDVPVAEIVLDEARIIIAVGEVIPD
jgi:hypothetical protein